MGRIGLAADVPSLRVHEGAEAEVSSLRMDEGAERGSGSQQAVGVGAVTGAIASSNIPAADGNFSGNCRDL